MNEFQVRVEAIPDLSDLRTLTLLFMPRKVFQGAYSVDNNGYGLMLNTVRSADMAVRYFRQARKAAVDAITADETFVYLESIISADFESCVLSLARSNRFLHKVLGYSRLEPAFREAIPKDELVLQAEVEAAIRQFRNDIQHWESRLADEAAVDPGQALALWAKPSGLEIGGRTIEYGTLGDWIRSTHRCAGALARA